MGSFMICTARQTLLGRANEVGKTVCARGTGGAERKLCVLVETRNEVNHCEKLGIILKRNVKCLDLIQLAPVRHVACCE
jgi:hypothetical protein